RQRNRDLLIPDRSRREPAARIHSGTHTGRRIPPGSGGTRLLPRAMCRGTQPDRAERPAQPEETGWYRSAPTCGRSAGACRRCARRFTAYATSAAAVAQPVVSAPTLPPLLTGAPLPITAGAALITRDGPLAAGGPAGRSHALIHQASAIASARYVGRIRPRVT